MYYEHQTGGLAHCKQSQKKGGGEGVVVVVQFAMLEMEVQKYIHLKLNFFSTKRAKINLTYILLNQHSLVNLVKTMSKSKVDLRFELSVLYSNTFLSIIKAISSLECI